MSRSGQMPSDYGEHWSPEADWSAYARCFWCGAERGEPCRDLRIRHLPARPLWSAHFSRPRVVESS